MHELLPTFRYHPDPITTGSVMPSDASCKCCGLARGHIYTGSVYAREELHGALCPWCIADGTAAEKFDAAFSDGEPLIEAGVSGEIVIEVTRRTPGYSSWQQEVWLSCCADACVFQGDAPAAELKALHGKALTELLSEWQWDAAFWDLFVENYRPGGGAAIYRFMCLHCGGVKFGLDLA